MAPNPIPADAGTGTDIGTDTDTAAGSAAGAIAAVPVPVPAADGALSLARRQQAYAAWLQGVAAAPYAFDLFQTLRHIESAHPQLPRLGAALRVADEPVRVGQPAEFTFAPAAVSALVPGRGGRPAQLTQRAFGLLGPNGPLPLHLTEVARERSHAFGDAALQRFLDTLSHRFALLFYRAWAQAQPVVGLDRPGQSDIARWLGSLSGIGNESQAERDAAGDAAKLHFTGRLSRQVRDADGLLAWCQLQFDVPLRIEQWSGHWMLLSPQERTRLTRRDAQGLGQGAVAGARVWDVQHKFRIVMGPLRLHRYQRFLPGGRDLDRLQAMVRQWTGLEFEWDLQLILARADVPALRLGQRPAVTATTATTADHAHRADQAATRTGALGQTAWLGRYTGRGDADQLVIDVERSLHARRARRRPAPTPASAAA